MKKQMRNKEIKELIRKVAKEYGEFGLSRKSKYEVDNNEKDVYARVYKEMVVEMYPVIRLFFHQDLLIPVITKGRINLRQIFLH